MVSEFIRDVIARRIAGDIVWSEEPGIAMKKWRELFKASQVEVAKYMMVAPSVISDYEKGRRVPGSRFIKRFVEGLLRLDEERGWNIVRELARSMNLNVEAIIDMLEYEEGVGIDDVITAVKGIPLSTEIPDRKIYGYTVLDSLAAIETMTGNEFQFIMGMTTERALIFTRVSTGRSPMVAVRVAPLKPAMVIVHGPRRRVDVLALRLADKERIPYVVSLHKSVDDIIKSLRSLAPLRR